MTITGGMASLTGKSVHVICEKAITASPDEELPPHSGDSIRNATL